MRGSFIVGLLIAVSLSACANVPAASPSAAQEAKKFTPQPNRASIYIYRVGVLGANVPFTIAVDGRILGQTVPGTFLLAEVEPRHHKVMCAQENIALVDLAAESGHNYFVRQEGAFGI